MKNKEQAILEALESLNSNYGVGAVVSVQIGSLTFTQKPFQCTERTKRFKIVRECKDSITVSFKGREKTIYYWQHEFQYREFKREIRKLLVELKKQISDDYRCSDDPDDDKPGMCVTVSTNDFSTWDYQTGDNSYTGGCYGHRHWSVIYLYRNSNSTELANDAVEELAGLVTEEESYSNKTNLPVA